MKNIEKVMSHSTYHANYIGKICKARSPAFSPAFTPTVATGIPDGIWTGALFQEPDRPLTLFYFLQL